MRIFSLFRKVYSLQQKLIELKYRKAVGPAIYMFHQVTDEKNLWIDKDVCITYSSFCRWIEMLQSKSINFYPIEKVEEHLDDSKAAFITFDDIFADAYENAISYLEDKDIPYTVFITENYVDKVPFISQNQLQKLKQSELCTIGYHTKNHPIMRAIGTEKMQEEIADLDYCNSKEVKIFAFPYGSIYACTKKSIKFVKKCGYKMGFSTIAVRCSRTMFENNRWFLPRINVNEKNYTKVL